MVDFLGQELNVGDKVVGLAHQKTSSTLLLGTVSKITEKMVAIETIKKEPDWRYGNVIRLTPEKIVKVNI